MILGIDVGGTTVKFGIVSDSGKILESERYETHSWEDSSNHFVKCLGDVIEDYQNQYNLTGIGLGLPGLLSLDRNSTIRLPNIPVLNNTPIVPLLQKRFSSIPIKIENDAKCAALGEMYFGSDKSLDNYMLITLGTGVGSGLVIGKELFLGGRGNATEIGHIPVHNGKTLEECIGLKRIVEYANNLLKQERFANSILQSKELSPKVIYGAALENDQCALDVFEYVGGLLGEVMIAIIRVCDINTFLLGGGVSGAFEYIEPAARKKLKEYLPEYYLDSLTIDQASMKENAGILGAASLIINKKENEAKASASI
jgi:glucokinase